MLILSSFFFVIKENLCIAILFVCDIVKCLHAHCVVGFCLFVLLDRERESQHDTIGVLEDVNTSQDYLIRLERERERERDFLSFMLPLFCLHIKKAMISYLNTLSPQRPSPLHRNVDVFSFLSSLSLFSPVFHLTQ